ncbi:MAG TPA: polysaccharide biosynthesis protein [Symbiobacteriaceae bacterium]|nr:polysaccharide biosynthesis protein [Symbiobacteriaceae bacterium]
MQSKAHAQNFMRGAFLITLAQLVTKILGAFHRPGAQLLMDDAGLRMATPPSQAYFIMLALSSVGINVAISRLLSERLALEDYRGARRVFRVAAGMLLVTGVVFSTLFAMGSKRMAAFFLEPETWPGFLVLAPALFFVSVLCAFRGLYQGIQQMQASAVSQVVEQVARVVLSLVIIALLTPVPLKAAAFNGGSTIGTFAAALYLVWKYLKDRPTAGWTTVAPGVESYEHESTTSVMGKILAIAAPLALIGAILPIMGMVDSRVVPSQLMALGVGAQLANEAGKAWLANAGTLRDLPTILTTALYISLVPAIAESYATGQLEQARYRTATAFRITFLIGFPATAGLFAAAQDLYGVLYKGPGWVVMAPLALSTIVMMMQQTASGALQGIGRIWLSVRNLTIGVVVKTVLTYWWAGIPALQAQGAAHAWTAGFLVAAGLQLLALKQHLGFRIDWKGDALRPALASVLMGVALWLLAPLARWLVPVPRVPGLLLAVVGGLIYGVAILLMGGITVADIGLVPGLPAGSVAFLRRYRLLRD